MGGMMGFIGVRIGVIWNLFASTFHCWPEGFSHVCHVKTSFSMVSAQFQITVEEASQRLVSCQTWVKDYDMFPAMKYEGQV